MSRKHCRPPTAELWCWAIYYPKWFTRFLRPSTQVKRGCWIDKQSQRGLCIPGAQQWGQLFISPSGSQLEKEMASHSSILAWKIPWTEEPGRLQSMELQRVRHNWATSLFWYPNPIIIMLHNIPTSRTTSPIFSFLEFLFTCHKLQLPECLEMLAGIF